MYCVGDEDERGVSDGEVGTRGAVSPRTIKVPTLGDHLKAANPASKVVSVTGKDRSAVALGGFHADLACWWNRAGGGFMTSTYYMEALPVWVTDWNAGWLAAFDGFEWTFSAGDELPGSGTAPDDRDGEKGYALGGKTFPYVLPRVEADGGPERIAQYASMVYATPLVDRFTLELARLSLVQLGLGEDEVPDLLSIGLSACDTVGHAHGPYSREVTDVLLRADDALGELFVELDERVGRDRWVAVLAADHGALPLPEWLRQRGVDAARVTSKDVELATRAVRDALAEQFGHRIGVRYDGGLVLDPEDLERHDLDGVRVRAAARDALAGVSWVARAFTHDELLGEAARTSADPLMRLAARSVTSDRGADVIALLAPWHMMSMATGTTHGSPYPYDRRIPLAFLGPGFEAGDDFDPARSIDVVPTLLARLGIETDAVFDGEPLQ